jgi:hypothetical protein
MKKNALIALILLTILVIGTAYALSDEPLISGRGTTILSVRNPNPYRKNGTGRLSGAICVYYKDSESIKRETSVNYALDGGKSETFSIPGVIDGWSTLYCSVTEEYE